MIAACETKWGPTRMPPRSDPPPVVPPTGPAWFCAGTKLMTLRGEIPAERVVEGDRALTLSGIDAPLKPVLGVRRLEVDLDGHPQPTLATPIRVCADAMAPGVPVRDLLLAPGHAVRLEDAEGQTVLVPVAYLANGATILRAPEAGTVAYVQILLGAHDVLMADGMGAEAAMPDPMPPPVLVRLHAPPAAACADLSPRRPSASCLPMLFGAEAALLHAALLARAEALGHVTTDDPAFTLWAGGRDIPAAPTAAGEMRFVLPANTDRVRLVSRSRIPMELAPAAGDPRRLGVALARVRHAGAPIGLDSPAFGPGFLAPEPEGWRWTDGAGELRLPPMAQESTLEIGLTGAWSRYWSSDPPASTFT